MTSFDPGITQCINTYNPKKIYQIIMTIAISIPITRPMTIISRPKHFPKPYPSCPKYYP